MSDLNLINTLQLKIFVTVAEERTLKAAAVKIGQTPSAISQNIKALENGIQDRFCWLKQEGVYLPWQENFYIKLMKS